MSALYHVHGLKAVHINKDAVPPKYIMVLSMTLFLAIPHKHQSEAHSKLIKMYPKKGARSVYTCLLLCSLIIKFILTPTQ